MKSVEHWWFDYTEIFTQRAFGAELKVQQVSLGIDEFVAVCTFYPKSFLQNTLKERKAGWFIPFERVLKEL